MWSSIMGLANSKSAITSFENPEHSGLAYNSLFFVGGLYERVMYGGKKTLLAVRSWHRFSPAIKI